MLILRFFSLLLSITSLHNCIASDSSFQKFKTDIHILGKDKNFLDKRLRNQCAILCSLGCNCIEPEDKKHQRYCALSDQLVLSIGAYLKGFPDSEKRKFDLNRDPMHIISMKYARLVDERIYCSRLLKTARKIIDNAIVIDDF